MSEALKLAQEIYVWMTSYNDLHRIGGAAKNADKIWKVICLLESDEQVNSPAHYNAGEIECIDAIRAALSEEEFRGWCKGNIFKYLWRCNLKGGDVDLRKAEFYLKELLEGPK